MPHTHTKKYFELLKCEISFSDTDFQLQINIFAIVRSPF